VFDFARGSQYTPGPPGPSVADPLLSRSPRQAGLDNPPSPNISDSRSVPTPPASTAASTSTVVMATDGTYTTPGSGVVSEGSTVATDRRDGDSNSAHGPPGVSSRPNLRGAGSARDPRTEPNERSRSTESVNTASASRSGLRLRAQDALTDSHCSHTSRQNAGGNHSNALPSPAPPTLHRISSIANNPTLHREEAELQGSPVADPALDEDGDGTVCLCAHRLCINVCLFAQVRPPALFVARSNTYRGE
jgi:hypothetical protein